jgi:hypothetical protein
MLQLAFWLEFKPRLIVELIFAPMLFHQDSHLYIQDGELINLL